MFYSAAKGKRSGSLTAGPRRKAGIYQASQLLIFSAYSPKSK